MQNSPYTDALMDTYHTGAIRAKYGFIITICIIGIMAVYGCGKGNDQTEKKPPFNTQNKEVTEKESIPFADTTGKRIYRKDLPKIKVDTTPYFADYKGYRYYFPCGPCRDRFIREREEYLEKWIKKGRKIRKRKLE